LPAISWNLLLAHNFSRQIIVIMAALTYLLELILP